MCVCMGGWGVGVGGVLYFEKIKKSGFSWIESNALCFVHSFGLNVFYCIYNIQLF